MKAKNALSIIAPMIMLWGGVASLEAQVAPYLHYQGYLTDNNGNPITGVYRITFSLHKCGLSSNPLWSETHDLTIQNGLYDVDLAGPGNPIRREAFEADSLCFSVKLGSSDFMPPKRVGSVLFAIMASMAAEARTVSDSAITNPKLARDAVTLDKIKPNIISSINGLVKDGGNIELAPAADSTVIITVDDKNKKISFSAKRIDIDPDGGLEQFPKAGKLTLRIKNKGVTEDKIGDKAVTESKIADNAVTTPKIANKAVTTEKIADNAVTVTQIQPPIVSSVDSLTNDGGNIDFESADATVRITKDFVRKRILFSAKQTPVIEVIPGDGLEKKSDTLGIANKGVTWAKIDTSAVTTEKIANNAVASKKIADDAVIEKKIANNAVTAPKIANKAVTTEKIEDNAVTVEKIKPSIVSSINNLVNDGGNITLEAMDTTMVIATGRKPNTISFSARKSRAKPILTTEGLQKTETDSTVGLKLQDGGVTEKKIADNAVALSKIQPPIVSSINNLVNDGGNITLETMDTTMVIATGRKPNTISFSARKSRAKQVLTTEGLQKTETDSTIGLKLQDGGVNEKKIADNAVTLAKIQPSIVSSINNLVNDGGNITIEAADTSMVITTGRKPNTISFSARKSRAKTIIATGGLEKNETDSTVVIKIGEGSIPGSKITDNTITAMKIQPSIVSSINGVVNDGGNINLEAGDTTMVITTGRKPNTISFSAKRSRGKTIFVSEGLEKSETDTSVAMKIKDGGVIESKIADNAVTMRKIADNAVTLAKIQPPIISSINHIENDGGNIDLVAKNSSIIIEPNPNSKTISFSAGSIDWNALKNLPAWIANATIDGMKGGTLQGDIKVTNGHVEANKGLHIVTSPLQRTFVGVAIDSVEGFGIHIQHSTNYGVAINASNSDGVHVKEANGYGVWAKGAVGGGYFQASDLRKFAVVVNDPKQLPSAAKPKGLQVNGTSEFNGKATFKDTAEFKGPVLPEGIFSLQKTDAGIKLIPANYGIEEEVYISGQARLVNGFVHIILDKAYQDVIASEIEPRVIITPQEPAAGLLFIPKRSISGFEVRLQPIPGLESLSKNVQFDWLVIAKRRGYASREKLEKLAGSLVR